jgi:hypothetical protein
VDERVFGFSIRTAVQHADVDRGDLERMTAAGMTIRQIAAETGKGYSTVRYWLQRHGFRTSPTGRGQALNHAEGICRRHGQVPFARDSHGSRCTKCRSEQMAARRRRVKQMLVEDAGGRCRLCGYDRYVGALQFHHLDRETKSFQLGTGGLTRSLAVMRAEAAKCMLLCANCHAEVEGGFVSLV